MKNERIITHFQSYTTAQGCVKDLTSHFLGRIAFEEEKSAGEGSPDTAHQDAESSVLDDVSEVGGITLGTVAALVPGFGPVLTGGPAAGAVIGDVFGDYLTARSETQDEQEDSPRQNHNLQNYNRQNEGDGGRYLVAVDVNDEREANLAMDIMEAYRGTPKRTGR